MLRLKEKKHPRLFLLLLPLLLLGACVKRTAKSVEIDPNPLPVVDTCSAVAVTLENIRVGISPARIGEEVAWKVNFTGCDHAILIRGNNTANETIYGTKIYTTKYTVASEHTVEHVVVQVYNAAGTLVRTFDLTSTEFRILPPTQNLSCFAYALPDAVNVRFDQYGNLLDQAPRFDFTVVSNIRTRVKMVSANGFPLSNAVPSLVSSTFHKVYTLGAFPGVNAFEFTIEENPVEPEQAPQIAKCVAFVFVRVITILPAPQLPKTAAPTCTLTASIQNPVPGQVLNLTIDSVGTASSATIEGKAVSPKGGVIQVTAGMSKSYSAIVVGSGGQGTCTTAVSVAPRKVGFNYEDLTDGDYNDATVCLTGYFSIAGPVVTSFAQAAVAVQITRRSACDHYVNIKVLDSAGNIRSDGTYTASQQPQFSLNFNVGDRIQSIFRSYSGCSNSSAWTSPSDTQRVHTGYYCNQTGG